jgi:LysM repeat protein
MDNNMCNCKRCNGIVHEIKRGDTLYTLSRLYNVSVGNIMRENKGINPYNLMIGEKICIPMRINSFPFLPERRDNENNNNNSNGNGRKNDMSNMDMMDVDMMDNDSSYSNKYDEMSNKKYDDYNYDVEYETSDYDASSVRELIMNNDMSVKEFAKVIKKYI